MFRKMSVLALGLAAVLSLPMMAQTSQAQSRAQEGRSQRQPGGAYDQQIQQEVEKYLQKNDKLKDVTASVEDGIVTLTGTVDLLKHKNDAAEKIRHKDHVAGVRNQVQVTGNVPDVQLRDKLADKLRYDRIDRGLMFNNLNVAVQNGVATVSGNVRSPADKSSALYAVETTSGVKDVIDKLSVAPVSGFDDDLRVAIARRIYGSMPMYANDPQAPIRIVVENGRVGLYGVVNSNVDKQRAFVEASSTPGVFSVTNNLVVSGEQARK